MTRARREFLQTLSGLAAVGPVFFSELEAARREREGRSAKEIARDEDFWFTVQRAFDVRSDFVHLESGWYSAMPREVRDAHLHNLRHLNEITSFYLRRGDYDDDLANAKRALGELAGLPPEEFTICRNTTEALNTVILGLELERGDEIIWCDREYPSMQDALEQRADRDGTVNRVLSVPLVPTTPHGDDEVVTLYERAMTPKTKAILVSHMIYLTGQVLPVRKIADMAHERGVEVIVDAAHSFAHLDFEIPELGADYVGTSLHKWLSAPLGTGLLHVRKEKIAKVWPLIADRIFPKDDIRKFEHFGTRPWYTEQTLLQAIRFHRAVGGKRKEERLRYLKNYWVDQVEPLPGVVINTPLQDHQSCAIATMAIDGTQPNEVADVLFEEHRVYTVAVDQGVRVSPNLFTTLGDLDTLVTAIHKITRG